MCIVAVRHALIDSLVKKHGFRPQKARQAISGFDRNTRDANWEMIFNGYSLPTSFMRMLLPIVSFGIGMDITNIRRIV